MRTILVTAFLAVFGCSAADGTAIVPPTSDAALDGASPIEDSAVEMPDAKVAPPPVDRPAIACTDSIDSVYVAPSVLLPMSNALRGDVVRCAAKGDLTIQETSDRLVAKNIAIKAVYAVHEYRIAFRTLKRDGSAAISTARVLLPDTKSAVDEAVLIAHPTDGIADACVPSKKDTANDELALAWAAIGRPVIVPDYVGLGNDGIQAYLDNREQGQTILDGGRALDDLLAHGAFSKLMVVGYSQGGGAALSAQALEKTYGTSGKLVGVVAYAPEWPIDPGSFGYDAILANPNGLTVTTGLSKSSIAVMRAYAYFANTLGLGHATDGFPESKRAGFQNALDSLCLVPFGGYLQGTAFKLGDLVDDTLRTTLLSCIQTKGATCIEPGKGFYPYLQANVLHADPAGAPVVIVQGSLDQILLPNEEAACIRTKLVQDGLTPELCVDGSATHQSIIDKQGDFAVKWGVAAFSGAPHPTCATTQLPACSRP
ncbi:hypothetical protein BH09MYX1_BH09MYX1_32170 [soil metagenome]